MPWSTGSEKRTRMLTPGATPVAPDRGVVSTTAGATRSSTISDRAGAETFPDASRTRADSCLGPSRSSNVQSRRGRYGCQSVQVVPSSLNCTSCTPDRSSVPTTVTRTVGSVVAFAPPFSRTSAPGGAVSSATETTSRKLPSASLKPARSM